MQAFEHWLAEHFGTALAHRQVLAGGDICQTERITTADGRHLCVKRQPNAPEDFFAAEAAGLQALQRSRTLRVPEVYGCHPQFIAMEYVAPAPRGSDYWERLGEGLAALHRIPASCFGFERDNYCGTTPQPNPKTENGYEFFAQQRLLHQGQLALSSGHLSGSDLDRLEQLCGRLPELIPEQRPALLHGDLWGGNIHCDEAGSPVLIDPASYWGWPEADLAMTRLFGGFAEPFYQSYQAQHPLEPGWPERLPLYNLYHLLNHLNLFGSSYYPQVKQILGAYT